MRHTLKAHNAQTRKKIMIEISQTPSPSSYKRYSLESPVLRVLEKIYATPTQLEDGRSVIFAEKQRDLVAQTYYRDARVQHTLLRVSQAYSLDIDDLRQVMVGAVLQLITNTVFGNTIKNASSSLAVFQTWLNTTAQRCAAKLKENQEKSIAHNVSSLNDPDFFHELSDNGLAVEELERRAGESYRAVVSKINGKRKLRAARNSVTNKTGEDDKLIYNEIPLKKNEPIFDTTLLPRFFAAYNTPNTHMTHLAQSHNDDRARPELATQDQRHIVGAISAGKRNKDQQFLYESWKKSMLVQEDYAGLIGLDRFVFSKIILGQTKKIDPAALEAAQALNARSSEVIELLQPLIGADIPMQKIVMRWMTTIGAPTFDAAERPPFAHFTKLARILEVNRTTVLRWWDESLRPNMQKLAGYEKKVLLASKNTSHT